MCELLLHNSKHAIISCPNSQYVLVHPIVSPLINLQVHMITLAKVFDFRQAGQPFRQRQQRKTPPVATGQRAPSPLLEVVPATPPAGPAVGVGAAAVPQFWHRLTVSTGDGTRAEPQAYLSCS